MSKRAQTTPPTTEDLQEWYRQESDGVGVITSAEVEAHASKSSPSHYQGQVECIDVMRQIASPEVFAGHCRLTAFKYIWRAGAKAGEPASHDLNKAIVYLGWAVDAYKEQGR